MTTTEHPAPEASIAAYTDVETHDLVMEAVTAAFPGQAAANLRVLDAPSGPGRLAVRLQARGFDVTCCDIDAGHFAGPNLPFLCADLNRPLALPDASFDVVVSVAGLQRLLFPDVAVREFQRILKPGGRLFLALPNFATLRHRLSYLLYGTLGKRFDTPHFQQTVSTPEAHFRFPLTYVRAKNMVRLAGFADPCVYCRRTMPLPWLLLPVSLACCLTAQLRCRLGNERYQAYGRATRFGMLGSRGFLIVARKPWRG